MNPRSRNKLRNTLHLINAVGTLGICGLLLTHYLPFGVPSPVKGSAAPIQPSLPEPSPTPLRLPTPSGNDTDPAPPPLPAQLTRHLFVQQIDVQRPEIPERSSISQPKSSLPLFLHTPESLGRDKAYSWRLTQSPSTITEVKPAMDGQVLVIRTNEAPYLYVYGVGEGRFLGALPLFSTVYSYTAGGNRVLVFYPGPNVFQTFSLDDFSSIKTQYNLLGSSLYGMTMGAGNPDTAVCFVQDPEDPERARLQLLDLSTLHAMEHKQDDQHPESRFIQFFTLPNKQKPVTLTANNELTLIAARLRYGDDDVVFYLKQGSLLKPIGKFNSYKNDLPFLLNQDLDHPMIDIPGTNSKPRGTQLLPIHGTELFLSINADSQYKGIDFFSAAHSTVLGSLDPLPFAGDESENPLYIKGFPYKYRYFYYPESGSLIYISSDRRSILKTPLSFTSILGQNNISSPVVISKPSLQAKTGESFSHQLKTVSTRKPVAYALTLAPKGMTLSAEGLLRWEVPMHTHPQSYEIWIKISQPNAQPVVHRINLQVAPPKNPLRE